jgi:hypothetical protein
MSYMKIKLAKQAHAEMVRGVFRLFAGRKPTLKELEKFVASGASRDVVKAYAVANNVQKITPARIPSYDGTHARAFQDAVGSTRDDIAIVSLFRDRRYLLDRYTSQIDALKWAGRKHVVAVEGDSVDGTGEALDTWALSNPNVHVLHHHMHLPKYGSCVHPERFRILSEVANVGLNYVVANLKVRYVAFVESDLYYDSELLESLLYVSNGLPKSAVVAPMPWIMLDGRRDPLFYDTWAFRHDPKSEFPQQTPKWYADKYAGAPVEAWSAGTTLFCDAEAVYAGARFTPENVIVGFCREMVTRGAKVWAATGVNVWHPPLWESAETIKEKSQPLLEQQHEKVPTRFVARTTSKKQLLGRRFTADRLGEPVREVTDKPKILIITLHPTLARNEAALYHSLGWSVYTPWHAAGELGLFFEGHPCRTEVPKLSPATLDAVRRIDVQYGAAEHVPDIAQALCEFDAIAVAAIPNWLTSYCQPALAAGRKVFFRVYGHEYLPNDPDAYFAMSEKAVLVAAHASEIAPDGLWNSWRGCKVSALPVVPMGSGAETHNGGFALGVGNGIKDSHLDGVMRGNRVPWRTVDELSGTRISDRELEDLYATAIVSVDSLAFLASSHAHRYVIRYSSLEAMARGCPNLTLAGRGLHALMVGDGFTHELSYTWSTSSDASDLARWYLAHPDEAKRLGAKQRAWLQQRIAMSTETWRELLA